MVVEDLSGHAGHPYLEGHLVSDRSCRIEMAVSGAAQPPPGKPPARI